MIKSIRKYLLLFRKITHVNIINMLNITKLSGSVEIDEAHLYK